MGESAYVVSFNYSTNNFLPKEIEVDSFDGILYPEGINYYDSKELCQEQCNLMNQENKI